jgi:phosphatidate cytidylyltransferase
MQSYELEQQHQKSQLQKRIVFGGYWYWCRWSRIGWGWIFTAVLSLAILVGTREYFELVRSCGIATGMTPPS